MADLELQLKNELMRFSPREILINSQTLELKNLPKFLREKLSTLLECLEDSKFTYDTCEAAVRHQFNGDTTQALHVDCLLYTSRCV